MDAAEKEISGLQTTVSVQKGQLAGISSGQQQLQDRFNEAQVKLAEANARIHGLDDASRDYDRNLEQQMANRNEAYAALDALKKQMSSAQLAQATQAGEMVGLREQVGRQRETIAKQTAEQKALQARFDEAHVRLAKIDVDIFNLDRESKTFQQEKETLVRDRTEAYAKADAAKAELTQTRQQVFATSRDAAVLQEKLRAATNDAARANQQLADEQAKRAPDQAALGQARQQQRAAESQVAQLQPQLGLVTGELKGAGQQMGMMREQLRKEEQRTADTQRQLSQLQRDFQEAQGRATAAQHNLQQEVKKGPQADASQVQQLRSKVAQTEASVSKGSCQKCQETSVWRERRSSDSEANSNSPRSRGLKK